jgi:hypothetical protein
VTPKFEEERAMEQVAQGPMQGEADVYAWEEHEDPYALIAQGLRTRGLATATIGVEETVRFQFSHGTGRLAGVTLADGTPVTAGCRIVKDAHELALMRHASAVTLLAYEAAWKSLTEGMTQGDFARLVAQAQSQATSQAANATGDRAAQAQVTLAAQQAQVRSQIERLKELKSNGRVALELDPRARDLAALPTLTLEDGDRIVVPASPGFVAAMGSVNNENVFIHRTGKTVAEVIRAAGLTEDAEPDQAFLLRADGSIVARRDRGGFWGRGGFDAIELMPGDTVVIPAMLDRESRYNFLIRAAKDWTQILANLGLGTAALKTLRN